MKEVVAYAINRDDCEVIPDITAARKTINRLLAEATGKPMSEPSPYSSDVRTTAKFSPEDFVPDGDLTKEVWQKAEWVRFDHDMSGQQHFPEAETKVASLWTPTHVYFAFQCKYSTLNIYEGEDPAKERWELWNRDVAEVFANPEPARVNHYYEFEVAPNNQWIDLEIDKDKDPFNDAGWDSHFEHATRVDAQNHIWTCEMRIPVRSMDVRLLEPNAEWRINFYRADGPGDDSRRRFMCWSTIPEGRTFHVPTRFGIIRFVR
jgi:alpha-galactosidase